MNFVREDDLIVAIINKTDNPRVLASWIGGFDLFRKDHQVDQREITDLSLEKIIAMLEVINYYFSTKLPSFIEDDDYPFSKRLLFLYAIDNNLLTRSFNAYIQFVRLEYQGVTPVDNNTLEGMKFLQFMGDMFHHAYDVDEVRKYFKEFSFLVNTEGDDNNLLPHKYKFLFKELFMMLNTYSNGRLVELFQNYRVVSEKTIKYYSYLYTLVFTNKLFFIDYLLRYFPFNEFDERYRDIIKETIVNLPIELENLIEVLITMEDMALWDIPIAFVEYDQFVLDKIVKIDTLTKFIIPMIGNAGKEVER